MITLTIPEPTPSQNNFQWAHWSKIRQAKKRWGWLILHAANVAGAQRQNLERAKVTVTRTGARMLDYDNLVAGCKSTVIDNLVLQGYIAGDDPERLTVEYRQHAQRKGPHSTVITIEALQAIGAVP